MPKRLPTNTNKLHTLLLGACGLVVAALPAQAQAPTLAMLDRIEPGQWELRSRSGGDVQRICLRDGRSLIQLRHPDVRCNRTIATDRADMVAVHYTCAGQGYGHTTIRFESRQLIQLNTQGIADGMPFAVAGEARRIGGCPANAGAGGR